MADKIKQKKQNGKKGARFVTSEKIEEAKRKILQIVENLIEPSVSEKLLISLCNSISQDDYLDVIEERNLLLLCGYPLCPKEVKPIRQKYHISVKSHKVYDITERKCFCSNTCYKASNFLKAQLCTSPIWLKEQDAEDKPINLLCPTKNSGSAGEEVDLGKLRMTTDDIEWVPDETIKSSSESTHPLHMSDNLKTCAAEFEKLEISKQHSHSLNTDVLESTSLISRGNSEDDSVDVVLTVKHDEDHISLVTEQHEEKVKSLEEPVKQYSYLDSDDDDDCDKFLVDHKKYDSLISNNKYMPMIPKSKKRTVLLIDPIRNPDDLTDVLRISETTEKNVIPLELIQNVLITWFTVETFHIILGESKFESLKNKIIEEAEATPITELQTNSIDKLKVMRESYAKICLKLEKEEAIELNIDTFETKGQLGIPVTTPPTIKKKGKKPKPTPRKVKDRNSSGIIPVQMKEMEPVAATSSREVSMLPMVESLSHNTIRRQIVIDHLKFVYVNMLPLVRLQYRDISEDIRLLASTFSLSSKNVTFKPLEWRMIAVILFRMIEKKLTLEKIWAEEKCLHLLKAKPVSFDISLDQIDTVIASVTDYTNFKKLLGF